MRISKYWHSCLLIEQGGVRILVDPGSYSFIPGRARPDDVSGLTAILITHEHKDHVDPEALKKIHAHNPVPIYANRGVQKALAPWGIDIEVVEDRVFKIGGIQVEAVSAEHGPLPQGAPPNTAYLVDNALLIPGDSYDKTLWKLGVRALALPVVAPWGKVTEAYEMVAKLRPKFVIPIHDGYVMDQFLEGQYRLGEALCKTLGVDFRALKKPHDFLEI